MTATQLIAKLQEIVSRGGDGNVHVTDGTVTTTVELERDAETGTIIIDMTAGEEV